MNLAVKIQNVSKQFPQKRSFLAPWKKKSKIQVLTKINLEIPGGTLFALVGPNGAGKTTLLKIISTLLLPDEGEVWVHGFHHRRDAEKIRKVLSFATSQDRSFYSRITVRQNLEFFAALYGLSPKETRKKIKDLEHIFNLELILDRPFEQLSSGMKQRVALARSYFNEAKILLADEPTRSLDFLSKKDLRAQLKQFCQAQGKTVIFTTHDLREAEEIADKVAILREGKLHATVEPAELQTTAASNDLEELFVALCEKDLDYSDAP